MANKCLNILVRVDVIHVNILVVRTCGDHKKIMVTIMLNKVHLRREKQQTPLMLKFKTSQKCIKKLTNFLQNVESRRRRNYSSSKQSGVLSPSCGLWTGGLSIALQGYTPGGGMTYIA